MKLWLSLCTALVFAAGCAMGLLLNTERYRQSIGASSPDGNTSGSASDEGVVVSMVDPYPNYLLYPVTGEDVYEELGLDRKQRDRLERLFADHKEAVRDVGVRMAKIAKELTDGVLEVLTDEQEARFNEMRKRCSTSRIRFRVERDLVELREELDLRAEQVPAIYKHLFDAEKDRHRIYRRKRRCRETSKQMERIDEELAESLKLVLFPNQFEAYMELQDRKRLIPKKDRGDDRDDEKRDREKRAGKDCVK